MSHSRVTAGQDIVLDRTAEQQAREAEAATEGDAPAAASAKRDWSLRRMLGSAWSFFVTLSFSSLTRRIVFLNLAGLCALLFGVMYLSQFRAGLIDARVQSLLVQSEIIAGGYWLKPPEPGVELAIVYVGAVAPEAENLATPVYSPCASARSILRCTRVTRPLRTVTFSASSGGCCVRYR